MIFLGDKVSQIKNTDKFLFILNPYNHMLVFSLKNILKICVLKKKIKFKK